MRTDPQLYTIFESDPNFFFDLTNLQSPGDCELRSEAFKQFERTADAVIFPKDGKSIITIAEFQFQYDESIYNRLAVEMALIQENKEFRDVQGVIIFGKESDDPKTEPWCNIIRSFTIKELVSDLAKRNPDHPLVAVFQPIVQEDDKALEQTAPKFYNQIKQNDELDASTKDALASVYVNWLSQRFTSTSPEEFEMLLGEPQVEFHKTPLGQGFLRRAKEEAKSEGVIIGKRAMVIEVLEDRFGEIDPRLIDKVSELEDEASISRLMSQACMVSSIDDIRW